MIVIRRRPAMFGAELRRIRTKMLLVPCISPEAVRSTIANLLPSGHPKIERAAPLLGISVRTLQRRLKESGTSYIELVDDVRFQTACRLLASPRARIADVAAAVGFADPSSFSRAFARWAGMAPKAYRRQRASQSHSGRRGSQNGA